MTDCSQIYKGEHDAGAALNLALGKCYGFLVVVAAKNEDDLTGKVLKALIRPRNQL